MARLLAGFTAALVAMIVGLSWSAPAHGGGPGQIRFFQADTQFDGEFIQDSGWGLAEVLYVGQRDILYLNVVVNGAWRIENVPMMSHRGDGAPHRQFFAFDLGIAPGQAIQAVNFGVAITEQPLFHPPMQIYNAPVQSMLYRIDSGLRGFQLRAGQPVSMKAGKSKEKKNPRRPAPDINQPQGPKECVPGAVSNALKALNELLPPRRRVAKEVLQIGVLKPALDWNLEAGGCDSEAWPDKKKLYIKQIRMPIATEVVRPSSNSREMQEVMKKLEKARRQNCMIEMTVEGHCVLLKSVAPVEGRNDYTFEVAHDVRQINNPATAIDQTVTFDPTTGRIKAGWMMEGKKVIHWTIQCIERQGGGGGGGGGGDGGGCCGR